MTQEQLEKEVMELLLVGETEECKALQQKFKHSKVEGRDFTGCGFYTYFEVPDKYRFGSLHGRIDDVHAILKDPEETVLFVLWVEKGKMVTLEGVQCNNVEWRKDFYGAELGYSLSDKRDTN